MTSVVEIDLLVSLGRRAVDRSVVRDQGMDPIYHCVVALGYLTWSMMTVGAKRVDRHVGTRVDVADRTGHREAKVPSSRNDKCFPHSETRVDWGNKQEVRARLVGGCSGKITLSNRNNHYYVTSTSPNRAITTQSGAIYW